MEEERKDEEQGDETVQDLEVSDEQAEDVKGGAGHAPEHGLGK